MGNRKESLKRALGINEYPWSSDDENENEPSTSPIGAPRTDASPSSLQTSTAQQTRMDRDFFWSLLNGRSRITVPRSSSSIDLQLPPPRTHTQPLAEVRAADADSRTPASDMQRIRAFRMIGGSLSGCRPSRSCSSLFTAPRCPGSTVQFTDASTLMRARRRALQRATAGASALTDPSRCGGADANRCPSPRRRRATPPVPPVRNRIGTQPLTPSRGARPRTTAAPCLSGSSSNAPLAAFSVNIQPSDDDIEMRAAPPPVAAEASGAGAQHEDEAMLSCIYEDIELPRPRSRPAVVEAGGSGEQEAAGVASRNTSALALEEVVEIEIEEIVEIDVEGDGTAGATAASTDARAADNVAAEVKAEQNDSTAERSDQPHGTKRKREETEEPEPSTVQEFNLSLLRLLECPVCLEWMEPPMSQCRRGHLVCGRCRARLASCPVCRTAFSSVRNRAMEGVAEMLRYPCRHGCGREVRLRRRTPHEASCSARRYRCVAPACAQRAPMPHQELTDHLQSKHAAMLKLGRRHKFALKVNSDQHDTWVVLAMRELFHLRIDVDIRTWGVVVHVAYIGPKCKASSYSYEVTVLGQHNSRKLVYTRATHCDLESSSLNVSRQDCFHLTIDQALNFLRVKNKHCEPDKFLHFCVEITKKEEAPGVNIDDSDLS